MQKDKEHRGKACAKAEDGDEYGELKKHGDDRQPCSARNQERNEQDVNFMLGTWAGWSYQSALCDLDLCTGNSKDVDEFEKAREVCGHCCGL